MECQYLFRKWLGAVRQQAITWTLLDQNLCRRMVSLGHNELTTLFLESSFKGQETSTWNLLAHFIHSCTDLLNKTLTTNEASNTDITGPFLGNPPVLTRGEPVITRGTQRSSQTTGTDSPHKRPVIRRLFPCHDIAQAEVQETQN